MRLSTIIRGYTRWLLTLGLLYPLQAQVHVTPIVQPHVTFVNGVGLPCAGCKLQTFAAGTTTPLATYTDASGTSSNTNPIILDAAGGANIWVGANSYKFILKDALNVTIWSVDQVNAGNLFPCSTPGAIQIANSGATGLTCDTSITINTTSHTINVGALPANHVTIGALGTPTLWNFDTTSPATACASIGCSTTTGTVTTVSVTTANGVSGAVANPTTTPAITLTLGDITPTSVAVAGGTALSANQGNGAKVQHSTGTATTDNCAKFDANGNTVDAGYGCTVTPTTCNANGCYRTFGGATEQWGVISGCSGGACAVVVTFPTAFTGTTNLSITATCGTVSNCLATVASPSTTGFNFTFAPMVFVGGTGSNLPGGQPGYWYAIGQ